MSLYLITSLYEIQTFMALVFGNCMIWWSSCNRAVIWMFPLHKKFSGFWCLGFQCLNNDQWGPIHITYLTSFPSLSCRIGHTGHRVCLSCGGVWTNIELWMGLKGINQLKISDFLPLLKFDNLIGERPKMFWTFWVAFR